MDLRRALWAGAGLWLGLAGAAGAQPLLSEQPLTTLLAPRRPEMGRPLMPGDGALLPRSVARPGAAGGPVPCGPGGVPAKPLPGRAATGGSGAGEYARFLPPSAAPANAPSAGKKGGSAASSGGATGSLMPRPGTDRPLMGGAQRPLWSSGGPVGAGSEDAAAPGSDETAGDPDPAAGLPRDRPLWADSSSAPLLPGDADFGATPCARPDQPTRR